MTPIHVRVVAVIARFRHVNYSLFSSWSRHEERFIRFANSEHSGRFYNDARKLYVYYLDIVDANIEVLVRFRRCADSRFLLLPPALFISSRGSVHKTHQYFLLSSATQFVQLRFEYQDFRIWQTYITRIFCS